MKKNLAITLLLAAMFSCVNNNKSEAELMINMINEKGYIITTYPVICAVVNEMTDQTFFFELVNTDSLRTLNYFPDIWDFEFTVSEKDISIKSLKDVFNEYYGNY